MNEEITIQETRDFEVVWQICQRPEIFDRVTNDSWHALPQDVLRHHFKLMVENPKNHSVLVLLNQVIAGCFYMDFKADGLFEIHTMLLENCRGRLAIKAAKLALQFALQFEEVKVLRSYCPENMPETYLFARLCGWHKAGMAAINWIKNGIAYPMKIVELTKGEMSCPSL